MSNIDSNKVISKNDNLLFYSLAKYIKNFF